MSGDERGAGEARNVTGGFTRALGSAIVLPALVGAAAAAAIQTGLIALPDPSVATAAVIGAVLLPAMVAAAVASPLLGSRVRRVVVAGAEAEARHASVAEEVSGLWEALSQGDLSRRVGGDFGGAFAHLRADHDSTVEKLALIVRRIDELAVAVETSSREVSRGAADLAERTERQAAFLEESAAGIEELNAGIHATADNARDAKRRAEEAAAAAAGGVHIAETAVIAIRRIEESSGRVAEITATIDEIAFQTNLLALNASVEAARAGDAGRGFAVVAQEVRALSQRSAAASREIKDLIQRSGEMVRSGVDHVMSAGATLTDLAGAIKEVSVLVAEIAHSTTEQASGLDEVHLAANNMEETTQHNAALVEESAGVSRELADRAVDLRDQLAFFALDAAGAAPGASPVRDARLVDSFKIDHRRFVDRVRVALAGGEAVTSAELPDHHHCRLGRWYDRARSSALRAHPIFQALDTPHQALHDSARRALAAAEAGDRAEAGRAFVETEGASVKVIDLLDRLARDLIASAHRAPGR